MNTHLKEHSTARSVTATVCWTYVLMDENHLPIFVFKIFTNVKVTKTVKRAHDNLIAPLKRRSSVIDSKNGDSPKGPKSVAKAQIARQFTPQHPTKRPIATIIDDTDDAKDSRLIKRQTINKSSLLVGPDPETQAISSRNDYSESTTYESSATSLPRQPRPQAQPRNHSTDFVKMSAYSRLNIGVV